MLVVGWLVGGKLVVNHDIRFDAVVIIDSVGADIGVPHFSGHLTTLEHVVDEALPDAIGLAFVSCRHLDFDYEDFAEQVVFHGWLGSHGYGLDFVLFKFICNVVGDAGNLADDFGFGLAGLWQVAEQVQQLV